MLAFVPNISILHSTKIDRSYLSYFLFIPPEVSDVESDAIPMEFAEDDITAPAENDLGSDVREENHVAAKCIASSSESFAISTPASETVKVTIEEASCSATQIASSSQTQHISRDTFSTSHLEKSKVIEDGVQKLMQQNVDLLHQNKMLQDKVLQLERINKLREKEMNKQHEQEVKNKLQEMLSPFFTPG